MDRFSLYFKAAVAADLAAMIANDHDLEMARLIRSHGEQRQEDRDRAGSQYGDER